MIFHPFGTSQTGEEDDKESVTSEGVPVSLNHKDYYFEMQFLDDSGNVAYKYKSEISRGAGKSFLVHFPVLFDLIVHFLFLNCRLFIIYFASGHSLEAASFVQFIFRHSL